jgi:hypothetical protein
VISVKERPLLSTRSVAVAMISGTKVAMEDNEPVMPLPPQS